VRRSLVVPAGLAAVLLAVGFARSSTAADHAEAPITGANPTLDIADFFAWRTSSGSLVAVLTYAPLASAGSDGDYNNTALYSVLADIETPSMTRDQVADRSAHFKFGQNSAGDWGVQATLDAGAGTVVIEGPVETVLSDASSGIDVWAGPADDPFFFDLQGFQDTLASGTIAFDSSRDLFAGSNVTALVVEVPDFFSGVSAADFWSTTGTP